MPRMIVDERLVETQRTQPTANSAAKRHLPVGRLMPPDYWLTMRIQKTGQGRGMIPGGDRALTIDVPPFPENLNALEPLYE